jgi:hypothetical protein
MHVCCFVVSFRFYFEQPLCLSMNRESIWRSQGFINSIAWPYVAPQVFITYFLKNNTSLRQIYFENFRVWENSLISGSNWCLFVSFCIETWLGEVASKIKKGKGENHWPDAGPDVTLLDHYVRFRTSPVCLVTRRWFSGGFLIGRCTGRDAARPLRPVLDITCSSSRSEGSLLCFGFWTGLCQRPITS